MLDRSGLWWLVLGFWLWAMDLSWAGVCDCAVAVDVGHASFAGGATSARGRPEFEFNLAMGTLIHEELVNSGLTRSFTIIDPSALKERVRIAESRQADLFISVHHDSVQAFYLRDWLFNGRTHKYCDLFQGYSILVSAKGFQFTASLELAKMIGRRFREAGFLPAYHHSKGVIGGRHNMLDENLGIYQFDNLVVLKNAVMPAILIEFGVIVHRDEELLVQQPEVRHKLMRSVVDGIQEYNARYCLPYGGGKGK
ncbi:MAG: N-acetylmuramoyl-L-alanine amidase [Magnetococcales bacterium]|nr:N-acetylmuramoyl-L-alanine amidase [Magnetococcales bacterium]NGZ05789.1 N-acetylmuramoyl-L-alanine amidase [Magnetococcales bacterium]